MIGKIAVLLLAANCVVFYALFTGNYVMNPTIAQVQTLAAQAPGGIEAVAPFTVIPGQVYSIADGLRTNLAAVDTDGVDVSIYYERDSRDRVDVAVGRSVKFTSTVDMPPNAGKIIAADWGLRRRRYISNRG